MLIDSHVHLDDPRYDHDRTEVFARAKQAGVEAFITIGCDLATSRAAVALANDHPNVYATVGVHPHEVKRIENGSYDEFLQLARHPKVVAYGDIGLDYHYDHSPREIQRQHFREQVHLARTLGLPIVVHTREAEGDTVTILREAKANDVGGVFHCFSGTAQLAKEALELGFYLSFSGIITFRNATELREIVQAIPHDRLLIETDAPYLTPSPFRGKRNESSHLRLVAEKMAEIKEGNTSTAFERIAHITADNTRRLFKISSNS